jgi:hypothetical protein
MTKEGREGERTKDNEGRKDDDERRTGRKEGRTEEGRTEEGRKEPGKDDEGRTGRKDGKEGREDRRRKEGIREGRRGKDGKEGREDRRRKEGIREGREQTRLAPEGEKYDWSIITGVQKEEGEEEEVEVEDIQICVCVYVYNSFSSCMGQPHFLHLPDGYPYRTHTKSYGDWVKMKK